MKKSFLIFTIGLGSIVFSSCDVTKDRFEGDDNVDLLTLNVTDSDKSYNLIIDDIDLNTDVIYIDHLEGVESKITISSDKNVLDTLDVSIQGDNIKIKGNKRYRYDVEEFFIMVVNVPLKSYNLEGAFRLTDVFSNYATNLDIKVQGVLDGELNLGNVSKSLKVSVDGVSDFMLNNVSTNKFQLDVNGTISLASSGAVDNLIVDADGIFKMNFKNLIAIDANIKLDGTSTSSFNVTSNFILDVNGLGSVNYYGDPSEPEIKKGGLISVNKI